MSVKVNERNNSSNNPVLVHDHMNQSSAYNYTNLFSIKNISHGRFDSPKNNRVLK